MVNAQLSDPAAEALPSDSPPASPEEATHPLNPAGVLRVPVDVRSVSLAIIAIILSLYALQWAKEVVVPILAGLMLSYALTPLVKRLQRLHIPRAAGAAIILSVILCCLAWGAATLTEQTDAVIDTVPAVTQRLRELSNRMTGKSSTIERLAHAANELTAAAASPSSAASATAAASSPSFQARSPREVKSPPAVRRQDDSVSPSFDVRSYMLTGTLGVAALLGQIAVIFFVAMFVMSAGNSFRRKMVKLAGKRLSQKRVTVETLDEITDQIQRYLLVQIGVSVVVGLCTFLAFLLLGLHNAAVWGVAAGLTNLVPYIGAVAISAAASVVALVQFGTVEMGLVIGGSSFVIHTLVGNVLTPWWTGRASKMSPVAVFISVLVFGWLWGVWGLLLGVPILLVVKTVCDRVEDLKPIGELLGA